GSAPVPAPVRPLPALQRGRRRQGAIPASSLSPCLVPRRLDRVDSVLRAGAVVGEVHLDHPVERLLADLGYRDVPGLGERDRILDPEIHDEAIAVEADALVIARFLR